MPDNLHSAFEGVALEKLHIDSIGRVVVDDPKVAAAVAELGARSKAALDLGDATGIRDIICSGSMPASARGVLSEISRQLPNG